MLIVRCVSFRPISLRPVAGAPCRVPSRGFAPDTNPQLRRRSPRVALNDRVDGSPRPDPIRPGVQPDGAAPGILGIAQVDHGGRAAVAPGVPIILRWIVADPDDEIGP